MTTFQSSRPRRLLIQSLKLSNSPRSFDTISLDAATSLRNHARILDTHFTIQRHKSAEGQILLLLLTYNERRNLIICRTTFRNIMRFHFADEPKSVTFHVAVSPSSWFVFDGSSETADSTGSVGDSSDADINNKIRVDYQLDWSHAADNNGLNIYVYRWMDDNDVC